MRQRATPPGRSRRSGNLGSGPLIVNPQDGGWRMEDEDEDEEDEAVLARGGDRLPK